MQWQDKLANKILKCPYQHITFTMPHMLHTLAGNNPWRLYNILMRSAWKTLKKCAASSANLGATPGAIMVLHTFGADLKYHVHVHGLVTFGGMDKNGHWMWPKRKNKIIPFRELRRTYRSVFIKNLENEYHELDSNLPFEILKEDLFKKQWCVNAQPPTTNTRVIEQYLGRYICRVGLSKNRFKYDQTDQMVTLSFKDYRNKDKTTGKTPTGIKTMIPLVAIHQILQHCLPPYFQKCRYYGLHSSASYKKNYDHLPQKLKNNTHTIRTVFQIIKAMIGLEALKCTNCHKTNFVETIIKPDKSWITPFLVHPSIHNRGSPNWTVNKAAKTIDRIKYSVKITMSTSPKLKQ